VELAPASAYDEKFGKWRLEDLPILPEPWRFTVRAGRKKQLDILRTLMNRPDVEAVVNACDAGREGELIFRLVYRQAKCKKPILRLWLSSLEEGAIRRGFDTLRPGPDYEALYRAALCRSQADWLVGINATRLFSCLYGQTLNTGRVQSPTLAMLVKREQDIAAFEVQPFYTPEIDTGAFTAFGERQRDTAEAEKIRAACDGKTATVSTVDREKKTAAPPRLYDLTAMQRDCNRLFGFTAQQTLDYAQALYEKRLITYPRTDSRFITSDMKAGIPGLIRSLTAILPFAKGMVLPIDAKRLADDSKVTDHHALLPTSDAAQADIAAIPAGERDVLSLIALRLLCAAATLHIFEAVTVVLDCNGYNFTAKGKAVLEDGWKAAERLFLAALRERPEGPEDAPRLPELAVGQAYHSVAASVKEGQTSPPRRYSEGDLLAAMESAGAEDMTESMERRGLGTPATRAGVIERLVSSGLATRKAKHLVPTEKGSKLIAVLPESLKSPALTAEWEQKLGSGESGKFTDSAFMAEIAAMTRELVASHPAPNPEHTTLFRAKPSGEAVGPCPRCGGSVVESRKGFFCESRPCEFALWKDNRFFAAKRKTLDTKTAAALLKGERVFFSDLYSEKTGKTYAAAIYLEDAGGKTNYKLDFEGGK
jgi:DNA topoisomerase-3